MNDDRVTTAELTRSIIEFSKHIKLEKFIYILAKKYGVKEYTEEIKFYFEKINKTKNQPKSFAYRRTHQINSIHLPKIKPIRADQFPKR